MHAWRSPKNVVAATAASLCLWLAPSAEASTYSADFTLANDGFQLITYDSDGGPGGAVGDAPHVTTGGNPGGFIRHTDADSGASELYGVFYPPLEASTEQADYGGILSFDLRSTATSLHPGSAGQVYAVIAAGTDSVSCLMGAPTATWGRYSVTIDVTAGCWMNEAGQPATAQEIRAALSAGQVQLNADFGFGAGERTDLDNYSFQGSTDTTPPETTIDSGPANDSTISDSSPTFEFSSEPGASFFCEVDANGYEPCTSPYQLNGLSDGSHTFQVVAIDAASNADETPATRTFNVNTGSSDTTPPETSITFGPSNNSTITTTSTSFGFDSSEANSTFECRLDTGLYQSCTSPRGLSGLSNGSHTFWVRATDAAGNVDVTPAVRNFTVNSDTPDTTPPQTSIDSGPANGSTISTTSTSFRFSSSESGSTFECKLDSGAYASCSSPRNLTGLSSGAHTFMVRATDAAGNTDASPSFRTFTVDTSPPPDTTPPETTIDSGPANGSTISTTSTSFGFSSSESGSSFECKLDSGAYESCSSPRNLAGLSNGGHTFSVRATDAAGNTDASPATRNFTVDTGPPPDTVAPETSINSGPANGSTVTTTSASFTFSSSEANSTFECKLDSGAYESCSSPRDLTGLSDGSHTFSVRATDASGNTDASPASRNFTVDTSPPPDTTPPETTIDSGPANGSTISTTSTSFGFSSSEANSTFECKLDSGAYESCSSLRILLGLSNGAHTFSVRATDAAGNTDASPASRSFTVDTSPPDTVAPAVTIHGVRPDARKQSATVTFSGSDDRTAPGALTFTCKLDRAGAVPCTSPFTFRRVKKGIHKIQVIATDEAGNNSSPAFKIFKQKKKKK